MVGRWHVSVEALPWWAPLTAQGETLVGLLRCAKCGRLNAWDTLRCWFCRKLL